MIKRFMTAVSAFLLAVTGVAFAGASPALADTIHGCNIGSVCIYQPASYGTPMTSQTTAAIFHAAGDCWQFNSTWSNTVSSWIANFTVFNGQTASIYFYDNTTCTGTSVYLGQAPNGQASMGSHDNWTGSIKLVQP